MLPAVFSPRPLTRSYAYFINSNAITRIKLSDNSISTITGLPALTYYKADIINNTLYLEVLFPGSAILQANLANISNGQLSSYSSVPNTSSPGSFVIDPSQLVRSYTGRIQHQQSSVRCQCINNDSVQFNIDQNEPHDRANGRQPGLIRPVVDRSRQPVRPFIRGRS